MKIKQKTDLRNLTKEQLAGYLVSLELPPSRAHHLFSWLQRPETSDFAQMHTIKKEIRERLAAQASIGRLNLQNKERSEDGTIKFGFALQDGEIIESVLIPTPKRHTLCVSSQAGCAMGCKFCLTGTMGLKRNLTPSEIVGQVLAVMKEMTKDGIQRATPRELINNLVFMGMGEPLANYDNLKTALNILMDKDGLEFTERRITVSTCGIVPKIKQMPADIHVNLAVSLHAADNDTRNLLMPVNRTHSLDDLLKACRAYPLQPKKVILFAYILISGVNDTDRDAMVLAQKLTDIPCRINLLPYNESPELPFKRPSKSRIESFQKILRDAGFRTIVRDSRGSDISAACGQLAKRQTIKK
jgi:23S rRNA (adenine2503-C2)-methyltransferase